MAILIGTSGYDYPEWVGEDRFYPASLEHNRRDWLTYYASQFPLVELNFTYYGTTSPQQLEQMVKRVEPKRRLALLEGDFAPHPDFGFVIKTYATLTHEIGDNWRAQAAKFKADTAPLSESGRLLGVLAQFPSRFRLAAQSLDYVKALAEQLEPLPVVAEFRHSGWFADEPVNALTAAGVVTVGVDAPEESRLPRSLEGELDAGAGLPFTYFRLHGRREGSWWAGDAASRYEYRYSAGQLEAFCKRLATSMAPRTLVLFNNHRHADAVKNARQLDKLLNEFAQIYAPKQPE